MTLVCFPLGVNLATAACLYLMIIVLVSLQGSFVSSAVVSLIAVGCLAYYFAPPIFSFRVDDPLNVVAILTFLTTSWVITHLVTRLRRSKEQEFNMRLEERVGERTRIARGLLDTLLRRFQDLIYRFETADRLISTRPGEAKQTLESALDDAAQTIIEARDAIYELHSSNVVTFDLMSAVASLGAKLALLYTIDSEGGDLPNFLIQVEGTPKEIHPILRDEIYQIAGQALRNAFRARARRVEVEIRYDQQQLRVRVRDDGGDIGTGAPGLDGRIEKEGLIRMRELAKNIHAELDFRHELGTCSEVALRIPGSIAYQTKAGRRF
jgi:signal transduction histidine kinase